jgi:hypothetical protein
LEPVTVDGPIDWVLIVGLVQVRVHDPRAKDGPSERPDELTQGDVDMLDGRPELTLIDFLNEEDDEDDEGAPDAAGIVRTFSRASKRRLGRAIAKLDWSAAIEDGDRLALFTSTYPGDWQTVCPNPEAAYRHLRALGKRFERATGRAFMACGSGSSSVEAHHTSTS